MSASRIFKALQITVDTAQATAQGIPAERIPRWLEADMWRSMNARWRPELLQHAPDEVCAVLQLPLFHQWGGVSKGTLRFLDEWKEKGVLDYREVALIYDAPDAAPRLETPPAQKETA